MKGLLIASVLEFGPTLAAVPRLSLFATKGRI